MSDLVALSSFTPIKALVGILLYATLVMCILITTRLTGSLAVGLLVGCVLTSICAVIGLMPIWIPVVIGFLVGLGPLVRLLNHTQTSKSASGVPKPKSFRLLNRIVNRIKEKERTVRR
jgi:hypothetical protein